MRDCNPITSAVVVFPEGGSVGRVEVATSEPAMLPGFDLVAALDFAARAFPGTDAELRVYLNLVSRADEQGECWPSYERMARDIGKKPRRTMDLVKSLVERGLVHKSERRWGPMQQSSNLYRVRVPEIAPLQRPSVRVQSMDHGLHPKEHKKEPIGFRKGIRDENPRLHPGASAGPLGPRRADFEWADYDDESDVPF